MTDRKQKAEAAARAMGWDQRLIGSERCESVECRACGKTKAPIGRSVPMECAIGYCGSDCWGYRADPWPGDLWPGETREEFGYPRVWFNGNERSVQPDLDDWRFVGAMIEWLWARDLMSHDVLSDAIVDEYDDEGVRMESPFKWGRFLAIAVIAQAKREAKR